VKFGENIDVVTYINGKRETHNSEGRAYAPVVWDYYQVSDNKSRLSLNLLSIYQMSYC